jgi:toxin ParE1/3/4
MQVVLTEQAYADLRQIGAAIKADSPTRAASFVTELYESCLVLGAMPRAFALVPGWAERGIRRKPYGDYLIFYRIEANVVEVIYVLHGARDYEAILFPTDDAEGTPK